MTARNDTASKQYTTPKKYTEDDLETVPALKTTPAKQQIQPQTKDERKELALASAGVTDGLIGKVLKDGLSAGKWEQRYDSQGNSSQVWVPDLVIQHKFLDTAVRMLGWIRPDANIDNSVNFNLTVDQRAGMKKRILMGYSRKGLVIDV